MNINGINNTKLITNITTISQIKIPMIQRDYVQGLDENNNKLARFLDALYNILNSNNNDILSLDFIYGNINENGVFEPIDGQQRLTTLALLNFYFFCKQENNINENNTYQNAFEYITYTTRQSAEKFCKILSSKDFIEHFKNNISNKQPSSIINEYNKYFKEYNDDTTIVAMINALDKIHDKFKNLEISKYKNIDKITFNILPMNNFNLSDDLYIKMNGRGKQLSNFDNFKADYFKWLENRQNNLVELIPDNMNIETLKIRFNTNYIDIFWDFAIENNNSIPDPERLFFRFINRFVVGKYLVENNKDNNFEKTFFQNGIKSESDEVEFEDIKLYSSVLNKNNNNHKLINILENLTKLKKLCNEEDKNFKKFLSDIFTSSWGEKIDIFKSEITNTNQALTFQKVLIFNSVMLYFETLRNISDINLIESVLNRIARITWNIAEQYHIFTAPTLINRDNYHTPANKLLFISKFNENIYMYLGNLYDKEKHNNGETIDKIFYDEALKCKYINKDTNITYEFNKPNTVEYNLIEIEKLTYLHGIIGFILDESLQLKYDILEKMKLTFSDIENNIYHKNFIRALLSRIKKISLLKSNIYKENNIIRQLINELEFRREAKIILEMMCNEKEWENYLNSLHTLHSNLDIKHTKNINDYENFTALCAHESLYREENNINEYKIHLTNNSYWLMKSKYVMATTNHMRSYCPVRYKLITGLKILTNNKVESEIWTSRNEHIYVCNTKIMFELNSIYINNYNSQYKLSLHSFTSLNSKNIDEHVLNLYNLIIEKSYDFEELQQFLQDNQNNFKNIIANIENYTNPFEN